MSKQINLYEILKGHEGKTFYYYGKGNVVLEEIQNRYDEPYQFKFKRPGYDEFLYLSIYGTFHSGDNSLMLFPSETQRNWEKWDIENNHKTPKTWSELAGRKYTKSYYLTCNSIHGVHVDVLVYSPIEKSAIALLKINQIIEHGYGGNVTNLEWKNLYLKKYVIIYDSIYNQFIVSKNLFKSLICFHTKEQAEEFLSYTENVQLLKDYFMI